MLFSNWFNSPIDGRHTGHVVLWADALGQQSIAYLPREHRRVLALVVGDRVDHGWRGYFGFRAANDARLEAARFVVAGKGGRESI